MTTYTIKFDVSKGLVEDYIGKCTDDQFIKFCMELEQNISQIGDIEDMIRIMAEDYKEVNK